MKLSGHDWLSLVKVFTPMVLSVTPLAPLAPFIAAGIEQAEDLKGKTGKEKLDHAVEIARTGIAAANAQAGKVVVDPAVADKVIQDGISTVVGVVNLTHRQAA